MLLSQTLSPVAIKNGIKPAFKYLKDTISYKDFWETSSRFSYFLQKEIGHGNRVGLWMSNCPHFAYCFIALTNTKNCAVPLNPKASLQENLFKIRNAGITHILCSSDHVKTIKDMLHENALSNVHVMDMETKRCSEYDPSYTPPASHQPNENDDILLFYTPGTTGKYKGCLFNHKAISQAMTAVKSAYRALPTDVFFTQHSFASPMSFIHYLLAPLAAGSTIYISDHTDFSVILPAMVEQRVTRMAPIPSMVAGMLQFSETEKLPIVTVKTFTFSGMTLRPDVWEDLKKKTKVGVVAVYGLTEYLGTVAMSTPDFLADSARPEFIGPPLVGTKIRVVDDNNDEIDKKKLQRGQLLVMGSSLMSHYLELPEDQKLMVRGTWLFTGDVVEIDKDGNMMFLERKADIITLHDGVQIFPKEIEPYAYQIPQVEEAAFIMARDRLKKVLPALVLVRKPQATLNEHGVIEFLAGKIPPNKQPKVVLFIDAMPRTVSGAINRAKLRSLFDGI